VVGNAWLEPFFIYRREIWNSEFLSIFSSRALKLRLYSVLYYVIWTPTTQKKTSNYKEVISGVKCIVLRKYPQNYFIKSKLYTGKLIKVFNQYVKWKNLEYQYIYIYFLIGVVNEVGVFAHPFRSENAILKTLQYLGTFSSF